MKLVKMELCRGFPLHYDLSLPLNCLCGKYLLCFGKFGSGFLLITGDKKTENQSAYKSRKERGR